MNQLRIPILFALITVASVGLAETVSGAFPFEHNNGDVAINAIPTRGLDASPGLRSSGTLFVDGDGMTFEHSLTARSQNIDAGAEATLQSSTTGAYEYVPVILPNAFNFSLSNSNCDDSYAEWQINGSPWPLGSGTVSFDWREECVQGGGACPSTPGNSNNTYDVMTSMSVSTATYCGTGDRMCVQLNAVRGDGGVPSVEGLAINASCIIAR